MIFDHCFLRGRYRRIVFGSAWQGSKEAPLYYSDEHQAARFPARNHPICEPHIEDWPNADSFTRRIALPFATAEGSLPPTLRPQTRYWDKAMVMTSIPGLALIAGRQRAGR